MLLSVNDFTSMLTRAPGGNCCKYAVTDLFSRWAKPVEIMVRSKNKVGTPAPTLPDTIDSLSVSTIFLRVYVWGDNKLYLMVFRRLR
jgi:hypothetical protein